MVTQKSESHFICIMIVLFILTITACHGSKGGDNNQSMAFSTVDIDGNSGINSFRTAVILDGSSWNALWNEDKQNKIPMPEVPLIDFGQKMVIGVFLGSRPNICYSVGITSISLVDGQKLIVNYHEGKPSENAVCGQAISYPSHIVSLNYLNLPVEFVSQ